MLPPQAKRRRSYQLEKSPEETERWNKNKLEDLANDIKKAAKDIDKQSETGSIEMKISEAESEEKKDSDMDTPTKPIEGQSITKTKYEVRHVTSDLEKVRSDMKNQQEIDQESELRLAEDLTSQVETLESRLAARRKEKGLEAPSNLSLIHI